MMEDSGFLRMSSNGDLVWSVRFLTANGSLNHDAINLTEHFRKIIREELAKLSWSKLSAAEQRGEQYGPR